MKKVILTLFVFFISSYAAAEGYSFDEQSCAVTSLSTVTFKIGEDSFQSKIKVDLFFKGDLFPLPKMRVSFLEHVPEKMFISWTNIIAKRSEQEVFLPEIRTRVLNEESQVFSSVRVSAPEERAVFETNVQSVYRAQDMVALFLSQNEFVITAVTENGDAWKAEAALSMSDAAFRKMASRCYPQLSNSFLKSNGERVAMKSSSSESEKMSSVAIHWSEGYGLTHFSWLQNILPDQLEVSQLISSPITEVEQERKNADFMRLALEKKKNQAQLDELVSDQQYIALNTTLMNHYQDLNKTYNRFVVLTSNGDSVGDNLISQKISEQNRLAAQIDDLEKKLVMIRTEESNAQAGLEKLNEEMQPFLPTLSSFEAEISERKQKIEGVELMINHLVSLLKENQEGLAIELTTEKTSQGAPWSVEQIEQQSRENVLRAQRITVLTHLESQVRSLEGELAPLLQSANRQEEAARVYLVTISEDRANQTSGIAALKRKLNAVENWLQESLQVPHFMVATPEYYSELSASIETKIANVSFVRNYDSEFDFLAKLYESTERKFVEQLEIAIKTPGMEVISRILCPPAVLVDSKNRTFPCLTVDEAIDEKVAENFFLNLPPQSVNRLLQLGDGPWTQERTKVEVLILQFQEELTNPTQELQDIVNTWAELRHTIWRWVTMQKEEQALEVCLDEKPVDLFSDKVYSSQFYQKVFECEKKEVARKEMERDTLRANIQVLNETLQEKESVFNAANEEFNVLSQQFVEKALNKINDVQSQVYSSEMLMSCILPLENVEDCANAVKNTIDNSAQQLAAEQQKYVDMTKALFMNINMQTAALSENVQVLQLEQTKTESEKQSYKDANNIDSLTVKMTSLKAQHSKTQAEIVELLSQKEKSMLNLSEAKDQQMVLEKEAASLTIQIQNIIGQIQAVLPEFETFCSQIRPLGETLQSVDREMYRLLQPDQPIPDSKLYSACQLPNLDSFVPRQSAIVKPLELRGTL
jgi:hypothetical protein